MKITFCLVLAMASLAATAKTKSVSESGAEQVFTVPVPQSEIKLESIRYTPPPPLDIEFSVSNWEPQNFSRGSYTGQTSTFKNNGLPLLSINRVGQWAKFDSGLSISSRLGLSYLNLQRTNHFSGVTSVGANDESMNFFIGRVGVESQWAGLLPWGIEPNVSFSVLPTWITAEQSAYEKSVGAFGTPVEATAGLLWRMMKEVSVGISGQAISGSIAGSNMKGLGILGALRMSL